MSGTWFDRLIELIKNDERDLTAISRAAKLGQNYVQQMIKDNKRPSVDRFIKIMDVLGHEHTYYVLTGRNVTPEDAEFAKAVRSLSPESRILALQIFQKLLAAQEQQERAPDSQG